jgi:type I restriction enzyme R subunit
MTGFDESTIEEAALETFAGLGYQTMYGPSLAPGEPGAERNSFEDVYLFKRLRSAARRINPDTAEDVVDDAIKRVRRAGSQDLLEENHRLHTLITTGVPVERVVDGQTRVERVRLVDFEDPALNDWVALNQVEIRHGGHRRRPDVIVYLNGLPVALFELKNSADEKATLRNAWNQIQTYRSEIPSIFAANAVTVLSDGTTAAMSTFSGAYEHFAPWKTIDGSQPVKGLPALDVLIRGVFEPERFLDLLRNFIVFSDETHPDPRSGQPIRRLVKRVAKYHQYWAVNEAIESTVRASGPDGDRRGGVVWHTQGSGKSLEMLFYAAKIMRDRRLRNPTLVFITDRNDLDDQLYGEVFAPSRILPEQPVQAESRTDLRRLLRRASGGIIFTTLQKFALDTAADSPLADPAERVLTDRRNVIVVADEAHRSQYGFGQKLDEHGRLRTGLASHLREALPGATYLGFTGTPIESTDRSTRSVFGDYIDVYDLTRAVEDHATVPIYYESRLAKVELSEADRAELDRMADEITETVETSVADRAKSRWARLEAIVGAESRLDLVARDIVEHWERRRQALVGKGMIVVMSRRIAVRLYQKIIELRPDWHSDDPGQGRIKVVMTGSAADPPEFQPHIHPADVRRQLKARAKDPADQLELVIVRDMWLTGFDAPCMHTMYVDKTMRGAGLMQAIARVNRTFRDKPGGLIVDYIGLFENLQDALAEYSPTDREQAGVPIDQIVAALQEKHDVITAMLHGVNHDSSPDLPPAQLLAQRARLVDHVLSDPDLTKRFNDQVLALARAYALCAARDEAVAIADDVRLFTDVRTAVRKILDPDSGRGGSSAVEIDTAIGQLVNDAVTADKVVDVYQLAGMDHPDLSLLSDEVLDSLKDRDQPNLQMGLLRRLIGDEIRSVQRKNVVQGRKFSELLEEAVNRYTNRSLSAAEVIGELVKLAKQMRDERQRGEQLGLHEDEVAFYDAVAQNESAVLELGDDTLKEIARNLVDTVRKSATIDWNVKESVRAALRARVKRLLARYDYPPDAEEQAVNLVLEQAKLLANQTSGEKK